MHHRIPSIRGSRHRGAGQAIRAVDSIIAEQFSHVTLSGGTLRKGDTDAGLIIAQNSSTITTILGQGFEIDSSPVPFGTYTGDGRLTGTLSSGDAIDNSFFVELTAQLILVPEPSTGLMVGIGLTCLAARRRRTDT